MKVNEQSIIPPQAIKYPDSSEYSPFGSPKRLQFGTLRIAKNEIIANDGTLDTVKIDSSGLHGYISSGTESLRVGAAGIQGYGSQGTTFTFYDAQGGTLYGQMGAYVDFPVAGQNSFVLLATNSANMYTYGSKTHLVGTATSGDAVQIYTPNGTANIDITAAGDVVLSGNNVSLAGATGLIVNGTTVVNGAGLKLAIMPTSEGYKALYCTESPSPWFWDFCYGKKIRKWPKFWETEWELKPDKLFLEVTSPPYHVIKTERKNIVQLWGMRKGAENFRFENKSKKEFEENNKFWATPKVKAQNAL